MILPSSMSPRYCGTSSSIPIITTVPLRTLQWHATYRLDQETAKNRPENILGMRVEHARTSDDDPFPDQSNLPSPKAKDSPPHRTRTHDITNGRPEKGPEKHLGEGDAPFAKRENILANGGTTK